MDFTFGICTYNSEKYIIQALESVKYQVCTYGENIRVSIIVSDDCSGDQTVKLIRYWLKINEDLFENCVLLQQEKNLGIAHNYAKLLDNIHTQYFKTMDGDDVISSINIFEQLKSVGKAELKIYFPIRFNEERMFIQEFDYISMYYYHHINHRHQRDLHMLETIKPFITPEACFLREEYSDETSTFVKCFNQFEDDTSLYHIFKNNSEMIMDFVLEPMILYRIHNKSLSNGEESIGTIKFADDLHKFRKYLFKKEKNLFVKLVLGFAICDTFRMKHRFAANISMFRVVANHYAKKRKKSVEQQKEYLDYKIRMEKVLEQQIAHMKYIEKQTQEYFAEYEKYGFNN